MPFKNFDLLSTVEHKFFFFCFFFEKHIKCFFSSVFHTIEVNGLQCCLGPNPNVLQNIFCVPHKKIMTLQTKKVKMFINFAQIKVLLCIYKSEQTENKLLCKSKLSVATSQSRVPVKPSDMCVVPQRRINDERCVSSAPYGLHSSKHTSTLQRVWMTEIELNLSHGTWTAHSQRNRPSTEKIHGDTTLFVH